MKNLKIIFLASLIFVSADGFSFDMMSLFRHSEIAGKNSLFADVGFAPLAIKDFDFPIIPFNLNIDYLPPLPLPFSFGFFLQTPNPNFKHFGFRIAYHFDVFDSLTDFYFAYSFDFGFIRNGILLEYYDTPVEIHFYDFRLGLRRFFKSRLGIAVETGFKFDSFTISFSIKIN